MAVPLAKDVGGGDGRRDYRKEAQEWAAGIKDKDTREYAAEAAELVLRKGFRLPRISFVRLKKTRGGLVAARYRRPLSFELGMGVIEINEHPDIRKDGGLKAMQEKAVEWGWSAQPNPILHEFGHMIDHYMHSTAYDTEIGDRFDRMDRDMVKKEVSQYAATEGTEFRAELISAILSGKTFTTDLLDAAYLDRYRSVEGVDEIYRMGSGEIPNTSMVERRFGSMMDALFHDGGASLKTELLDNPEVVRFIDSHSRVLDNAFSRVEMSDSMRSRLRASDWMFSGLKTFHELHEAFPSLLDENGERKPFERFLNDVQKIDETYNQNWLRAEYNFAGASAGMAARWEDFEEDGDRYSLQYRTAHDGRVRPEHAEMDGITLPVDDPFWDTNYPPNGWNCRCTVVQVLKADNEPTDRGEAYRRAESALRGDRRGMFRFNPGKEGRVFPAYNPYSVSACAGCPRSELKLARDIPANELCQACQMLQVISHNRSNLADERILDYDTAKWEHTYVSGKSNGFVVTEQERINEASISPNEMEKYERELRICKILADNGHDIQYLHGEGRHRGETYDILFDGIPADLKSIEGTGRTIPKHVKHALRDQGAEMVILCLPAHTEEIYRNLTEARRKYSGRIMIYFDGEDVLKEVNKK